jgi:hypothetical protein
MSAVHKHYDVVSLIQLSRPRPCRPALRPALFLAPSVVPTFDFLAIRSPLLPHQAKTRPSLHQTQQARIAQTLGPTHCPAQAAAHKARAAQVPSPLWSYKGHYTIGFAAPPTPLRSTTRPFTTIQSASSTTYLLFRRRATCRRQHISVSSFILPL